MSIKAKLLGGGGLISALLIAVLVAAVSSFGSLSGGFAEVVQMAATGVDNSHRTQANVITTGDRLTLISDSMLSMIEDIHQTNMQVKVLERKIVQISETLVDLNEEIDETAEGIPEGDALYALEDATDAVGDIEETMRREALVSLSRTVKKIEAFTQTIDQQAKGIQTLNKQLGEVQQLTTGVVDANQQIRTLSEDFSEQIGGSRDLIVGVLVATVVLAILGALLMTRSITRPLGRANAIARGIADGDLNQRVEIVGDDEIGQLGASMSVMIDNLKQNIEEMQQRADEASRIRMALDVCNTNVVVADNRQTVIYQNHSSESTLSQTIEALQADLPKLDQRHFIGSKLCDFHLDPGGHSKTLTELKQMQEQELVIGGRHLDIMVTPVFNDEQERLGTVMEWTDRTNEFLLEQQKLEKQKEDARIANANLRIKVALDNVSNSVMMADPDRNILYMNHAAEQLFKDMEEDLRTELPGFEADRLLGGSIDAFHKDPRYQEELLANLKRKHTAELTIGGHVMRIVANPVVNDAGERLGTAVEWTNRTEEVAVEQEVASIVSAAQDGDLSKRIQTENKEGFFQTLGLGINALIEQVELIFNELSNVMEGMAKGDLTQPIHREYKGSFHTLKQNVNETIDNLSGILRTLRDDMDQVRIASQEISSGNSNLSSRTEAQASSLEETAASMEELTSTVRNNADNAQQANSVSNTARQAAEKGGEVVDNAVKAMQEINESSSKIAEIIGVIDEIAFQTNLLALNASVEAARAGEQGRGFAVVATEVRNLASRSAEAAKQIKTLIHDSRAKVQTGTQLVNESGETLDEIVSYVKKVGDIVAEIAAASTEQSQGIDQVNTSVTEMDQMTQQNASLAVQASAASASMSEKAGELQQLVGQFRLN